MTVIVFDVPASSGGALTVLNEFYNDYSQETLNRYVFVVSRPVLESAANIEVLRYPWVKKSWLHRLYFDVVIAPGLVKKNHADAVVSLQNIVIPRAGRPQTLYVHNALPFIEKRFSLTESPFLWVYQKLIGGQILKSVKQADRVIVQTDWMKRVCIQKCDVRADKITVTKPKMDIDVKKPFAPSAESNRLFFYPASGFIYKNHTVIVDAAALLVKKGIVDFKIVFTLDGNENKHIAALSQKSRKLGLPIEWIGAIPRDAVFDYYSRSVLLFPSYIETLGLPLYEAKAHHTPILASDCPFSHEALDDYENALYFNENNPQELTERIDSLIMQTDHFGIKA